MIPGSCDSRDECVFVSINYDVDLSKFVGNGFVRRWFTKTSTTDLIIL
jgi:hypothetical protein